MIPGCCAHCDNDGIVLVNSVWLCTDHIDTGIRAAIAPVHAALEQLRDEPLGIDQENR